MDFKKCVDCRLGKIYEPGIALTGLVVGKFTIVCLATGEKLEITSCIKAVGQNVIPSN